MKSPLMRLSLLQLRWLLRLLSLRRFLLSWMRLLLMSVRLLSVTAQSALRLRL
jgi:hypothetical protein